MNYGINLYCYESPENISLKTQAQLMKDYGFTHTFTFSDRPAACSEGAELLSEYGIKFDTLHAPFKNINNIWKNTDDGDKMLSVLLEGIDKCKAVCAKTLIVHLSSKVPAPRMTDIGFSRFDTLMEYADKNSIKIAFENQRVIANIAAVIEEYSSCGFCWDVGHEMCFAGGRRYMDLFGTRLSALHIHDNHKEQDMDEHLIPFDGLIDFDYVACQIRKYKYTGTLMLELERFNSHYYDSISAEDYYKRASDAVNKLDAMINA